MASASAFGFSESDFKRDCEGLIREFFTHGVLDDVEDSLRELLTRPYHAAPTRLGAIVESPAVETTSWPSLSAATTAKSPPKRSIPAMNLIGSNALRPTVVKRAVTAALDRGPREREMVAQLIRSLASKEILTRHQCEEGFDLILQDAESLAIDVPNAPDEIGVFLARAVVDGVVSAEYLDECAEAAGLDEIPRRCAMQARGALRSAGGAAHVARHWGGPEGITADAARREMSDLLEEYVNSRDAREASRRLQDLAVPFYHHEFVRRALTMSMDQSHVNPQVPKRVMQLLGYLGDTGLVNGTQFAKGFARIATELREISLDVPDAREQFEGLVTAARERGLLPKGLSAWASIRGAGTGTHLSAASSLPWEGEGGGGNAAPGMKRNGGLRGHLLRLDSAPDLIKLAESMSENKTQPSIGPDPAAAAATTTTARNTKDGPWGKLPAANERRSRLSAVDNNSGQNSPVRVQSPGIPAQMMDSVASLALGGKHDGFDRSPVKGLGMKKSSSQVNLGWSGLRAPRAARLRRGTDSGSDSDAAFRRRQRSRLPSLLGQAGTAGDKGPSNVQEKKMPGLAYAMAHAHAPTMGTSAWRAKFQPAPLRVLGEQCGAFKSDASLRKIRGLRRVRSMPGGLLHLDNSEHILSIGYVHRHRPFEEEYDLGEAIGTGGFAVVRKAVHRATGVTYAVKTLRVKPGSGGGDDSSSDEDDSDSDSDMDSDSDDEKKPRKLVAMSLEEVMNELIMMQQLSEHPSIITIKEFFTEGGADYDHIATKPTTGLDEEEDGIVHVVMELLEGQELVDAITDVGAYDEGQSQIVMSSMLDAIAFMHARGVVHRDLKLENLCLAKPNDLNSVTLLDFGLAKALTAREKEENVCGTLAYVAPEALVAGVYGQGVDVWALGVAMHVLLTGTWPFDDDDEDELIDQIVECDLDFDEGEEWQAISAQAKDLLGGLLEPNPKRRLGAAQALEHAWFTGQKNNTSERLHHVHARLDALVGSSRQHPERRFKPGQRLCVRGKTSDEVFVITAGECEAFGAPVGALAIGDRRIGARRKGNLVGEIPEKDGKAPPPNTLTVIAKTEVRALVFNREDMGWAVADDYRLSSEFSKALLERRRALVKAQRLQARADREKSEAGGGVVADSAAAMRLRASSDVVKRDQTAM